MIFYEKQFTSVFDIGCTLPDHKANLYELSKEILRINDLILRSDNPILLKHNDNNHKHIYIDKSEVSEKTWYRSLSEVKELLYRGVLDTGLEQQQFSISKNIKQFGIYEPDDESDYKRYLQLLYFFYILNYYIYPKKNIFKLLSLDNKEHLQSHGIRLLHTKVLNFIQNNIYDDYETFVYYTNQVEIFQHKADEFSLIIRNISNTTKDISSFETFIYSLKPPVLNYKYNNVFLYMLVYIKRYIDLSYSEDMVYNLKENYDVFIFEKCNVLPNVSWKTLYVSLDNINEFISSDDLYMFVKQTTIKPQKRDIIKFVNSNAVKFFYTYIECDKKFMDKHNLKDGIFLQVYNDKYYIYALRIAVIIMVYNELVNEMMYKVKTKNSQRLIPLRSSLTINKEPSMLSQRLLHLCAQSKYKAITKPSLYPDSFIKNSLQVEIIVLDILNHIFDNPTINHWCDILDFYNRILITYNNLL